MKKNEIKLKNEIKKFIGAGAHVLREKLIKLFEKWAKMTQIRECIILFQMWTMLKACSVR